MTLKDRLTQIYGSPTVSAKPDGRSSPKGNRKSPSELGNYLEGTWKLRSSGRLLIVDRIYPYEFCHGGIPLGTFLNHPSARHLEGLGIVDPVFFEPGTTAFLDTETTGLSGGAGTCVFLVGVGYFDAGSFRVRQFFLADPGSEHAFLEEIRELFSERGFRRLVTFNGKNYDLALLENRFVLQRLESPFGGLEHTDLLHLSRALWKGCFEDCALQTLERRLLNFVRSGDVPGALIPQVYFRFLREGRYQAFRSVLEHNRLDLLTLVSLLVLVGKIFVENESSVELNPLSASRLLRRRGHLGRASKLLESALDSESGTMRNFKVRLELSLMKRRLGDVDGAQALLQEACFQERAPVEAFVEYAKILEHVRRDFRQALNLVERGLLSHPEHSDLRRRHHRLRCRMAGRRWY